MIIRLAYVHLDTLHSETSVTVTMVFECKLREEVNVFCTACKCSAAILHTTERDICVWGHTEIENVVTHA